MLSALTNSDGIPALERLMQFTGQRHRVILDNIANLSTPGFRPRDVSPEAFQAQLGEAIDAQRTAGAAGWSLPDIEPPEPPDSDVGFLASIAGGRGTPTRAKDALALRSTSEVEVLADRMILHPEPVGDNILFHDGNDRSVERVMQSLVENFMAYRASAQLLRNRLATISMAIRERI